MVEPIKRVRFVIPREYTPSLHLTHTEKHRAFTKDLMVEVRGPLDGLHGVVYCNLEELKAAIRFLESEMERAMKEEE